MNDNRQVATQPKAEVQEAKNEVTFTPFAAADTVKLSIEIVKRWIAKPTKQGKTCSDSDAMRFMMLCRAKRLNPFEGDAFLVGYDGKDGPEFSQITAHQSLLKRAEPQPTFKGLDSGIIVSPGWECKACESGFVTVNGQLERCKHCRGTAVLDEVQGEVTPPNQTLVGGWAHLVRTDRDIPTHRRLSLKAYRPQYPNKFWNDNPEGQIAKCAEADCLRSTYPTLVGGLYTESESGFAMVAKDVAQVGLSAPTQRQVSAGNGQKSIAAPATRLESPTPRKGPTLVEEPLSGDERAEAASGLAPESEPSQASSQPTDSQSELEAIVSNAGGDFSDFKVIGEQQGWEADWRSCKTFADVPSDIVTSCVAGKAWLVKQIKSMRGAK